MADQMGVEPETFDSITRGETRRPGHLYLCGCEYRKVGVKPNRFRWFLCSYHEGMEAGIELGEQRGW